MTEDSIQLMAMALGRHIRECVLSGKQDRAMLVAASLINGAAGGARAEYFSSCDANGSTIGTLQGQCSEIELVCKAISTACRRRDPKSIGQGVFVRTDDIARALSAAFSRSISSGEAGLLLKRLIKSARLIGVEQARTGRARGWIVTEPRPGVIQ